MDRRCSDAVDHDGARPSGRYSTPAAASSTRGLKASTRSCASWCGLTGFPITSTLDGARRLSGLRRSNWLGMLGMHGTYEANLAMHDCDRDDRRRRPLRRPHHRPSSTPSRRTRRRSRSISIHRRSTRTSRSIIADRRRCAATRSRPCCASGASKAPQRRQGRRTRRLVEADRASGGRSKSLSVQANRDDVIMPQYAVAAALRVDQGPRRLHHHRGRPASDVGGAASTISKSRTAG